MTAALQGQGELERFADGALDGPQRCLHRSTELADWPAVHGAFVAEIEHLRRVIELLPSLDEYLARMILPTT